MYNIELRNISKCYKNGVVALDNISFNVKNGVFGLLGHNGVENHFIESAGYSTSSPTAVQ